MVIVHPQLTRLKGIALDLLFPQWCVGCGRGGELICSSCRRSLPRIMPPICPLCGRPQASGILCSSCVSWHPAIDGIRSPFRFDGVIRQAVHQLKYQNLRVLAHPLAQLMRDFFVSHPLPGDVLVPVPMHQQKLRERGYNQAGLLAADLGKLLELPEVEGCLMRQQPSSPQARAATVEERKRNVVDAFCCRDERLSGKHVILIDDVATSGATLDACAAALKETGAISVWGLVMAREI